MTQINIPELERFSYRRTLEDTIAKLEAELKLAKARQDYAEELLEHIFENVREGRECYLKYKDRTTIWIAKIEQPKS